MIVKIVKTKINGITNLAVFLTQSPQLYFSMTCKLLAFHYIFQIVNLFTTGDMRDLCCFWFFFT